MRLALWLALSLGIVLDECVKHFGGAPFKAGNVAEASFWMGVALLAHWVNVEVW